jgi:hypothetical protein
VFLFCFSSEGTQDEDKQNKNTTQQVLGITLHKQTEGTQDEDKQNKNTTQQVLGNHST